MRKIPNLCYLEAILLSRKSKRVYVYAPNTFGTPNRLKDLWLWFFSRHKGDNKLCWGFESGTYSRTAFRRETMLENKVEIKRVKKTGTKLGFILFDKLALVGKKDGSYEKVYDLVELKKLEEVFDE